MQPLAEAAFAKALVAVQQAQANRAKERFDNAEAQWNLAIRYFGEAQKLHPTNPAVLFNLALSESKVRGRELRSIAWFHAYLTSAPHTPCEAAVKQLIIDLEVRAESEREKLIESIKRITRNLRGRERNFGLMRLAIVQADSGDISGALSTARSIQANTYSRASTFAHIAYVEAYSGDLRAAETFLSETRFTLDDDGRPFDFAWCESGHIVNGCISFIPKDEALYAITVSYARRGDLARAIATFALIADSGYRFDALFAIAEAQYNAGLREEAYHTLSDARGTISGHNGALPNDPSCDWQLQRVGLAQAILGDMSGAQMTANLISDSDIRSYFRMKIPWAIANGASSQGGIRQITARDSCPELDRLGSTLGHSCFSANFLGDIPLDDGRVHAQLWIDLIQSDLSKSVFVDFPFFVQSLANKDSSLGMLNEDVDAAADLSWAIKAIRWLSDRDKKFTGR